MFINSCVLLNKETKIRYTPPTIAQITKLSIQPGIGKLK